MGEILLAIKRKTYLCLFKIKTDDLPFTISIPIPLFLVEDFLLSISLLFRGFIFLTPKIQKRLEKRIEMELPFSLESIHPKLIQLFLELRSLGPFTLVEVEDGEDTKIYIKFI